MTDQPAAQALEARLLRHIEFDTNGGCWLWTASLYTNGYPKVKVAGKYRCAHRVSWSRAHQQELTPDILIMHKCDTPICINPDHLSPGTHQDNSDDCKEKGRASGPRLYRDRLTAEQRAEIIASVNGGEAKRSVGRRFGLTHQAVRQIMLFDELERLRTPSKREAALVEALKETRDNLIARGFSPVGPTVTRINAALLTPDQQGDK